MLVISGNAVTHKVMGMVADKIKIGISAGVRYENLPYARKRMSQKVAATTTAGSKKRADTRLAAIATLTTHISRLARYCAIFFNVPGT